MHRLYIHFCTICRSVSYHRTPYAFDASVCVVCVCVSIIDVSLLFSWFPCVCIAFLTFALHDLISFVCRRCRPCLLCNCRRRICRSRCRCVECVVSVVRYGMSERRDYEGHIVLKSIRVVLRVQQTARETSPKWWTCSEERRKMLKYSTRTNKVLCTYKHAVKCMRRAYCITICFRFCLLLHIVDGVVGGFWWCCFSPIFQ